MAQIFIFVELLRWLGAVNFFSRYCNVPIILFFSIYLSLIVPFVVSCCKFLKSIIFKTFNDIALAFLSVESKTYILWVNINFNGKLFFRFGRYCGKVFPEPAAIHLFECLHSQGMFFHVGSYKITVQTKGCPRFCQLHWF